MPVTPVLGLLWVIEGPRRGKYYPIKHGTIIGRKDCSLLLDDPKGVRDIPRAAEAEGYAVIDVNQCTTHWRVVIQR